jgi:hypothetical protein
MARRILWFALAYTVVIIVHETAHAVVAAGFGLQTTLHQFWADIDPSNRSTMIERALFGVAGPISSLLLGLASWFAYRANRRPAAAMPLLYLAAMGVTNFFGNLASAAFIGDFSNAARWLSLPMSVRYVASASGVLVVVAVLFLTGRALARLTPQNGGRSAAAWAVLLPAVFGTALIVLVNQPVPIAGFATARMGEAAFWVFAVAGAALTGANSGSLEPSGMRLEWPDLAIAAGAVAVVRIMALGIPLTT